MRYSRCLLMAFLLLAACSKTESAEKKDTYTMQKGGMSSSAHEMPASEATDSEAKKKDGYRMEKGGMSSSSHQMK